MRYRVVLSIGVPVTFVVRDCPPTFERASNIVIAADPLKASCIRSANDRPAGPAPTIAIFSFFPAWFFAKLEVQVLPMMKKSKMLNSIISMSRGSQRRKPGLNRRADGEEPDEPISSVL